MFIEYIDDIELEAFKRFTEEYGERVKDWCIYDDGWYDWECVFCEIKASWNTEAVRCWRGKILWPFIRSIPVVRNSLALFDVFMECDASYLSLILSLIELPFYPYELQSEIWG